MSLYYMLTIWWLCVAIVLCQQNLPEYDENYRVLMNLSDTQSKLFVGQSLHFPKMVNANPAVADWNFPGTKETEPSLFVLWCPKKAWKPPCQYSIFSVKR